MRGRIVKNEGKRGTSYTVVVDTGTDAEGNRKQKKKTFNKKGDAEKWLADTIAAVNKGTYIEPVKTTVKDWLSEWLNSYGKQNLSPTTYAGYKTIIEKHLIPELGAISLSDLKPKHIKDYHNNALEGGRKDNKKALGKGLSPTTVSQHHRVLREALQHALELEMIVRNPADAAKPPRKVKHEIEFLPVEDANKIVKLFKGTYMYMPVFLAVTLGARRSEILALRWSDIDFRNNTVTIGRGLYVTKEQGLFFKEPKNKTSKRSVAMSPGGVKALKAHEREQKKDKLAIGERYHKNNLICCLQDGSLLHPATVSKRFQEVVNKAGINVTFHGLRHAHASYLLKQGIHPKVVSERLGHSNISKTMDLYSHIAPTLQTEAASKLDELLFKGSKNARD